MNIWLKYTPNAVIIAPMSNRNKSAIDDFYLNQKIDFHKINSFDIKSFKSIIRTIVGLPKNISTIYMAMKFATHIHLRCPGNIGLLGCVVQVLFPKKMKTAKYAGNWDSNVKQPLSYRLQKWILSNTFLTRNMQVLVYGEWENSSKNIKPFFTASYFEKDKIEITPRDFKTKISFMFVGTLSNGKQPLYAIQLVENLLKRDHPVQLFLYGDGTERKLLENYIEKNNLENFIFLKGNQNQETLKKAYLENHFVILPSLSEGWPKVIAEGMFWGCFPIATMVSCVPYMVDKGNRGLLLNLNLMEDVVKIENIITDKTVYHEMVQKAIAWSRQFTLDVFEIEIKKLV